jgi:transposase
MWRQRLEYKDRGKLREQLRSWPKGTPVILESTFGWGWISDELAEAGLEPHLANSRKVAAWRDARGLAKSNRIDSDLVSELWSQQPRWWEVWLAPPKVREQREWMRHRADLVEVQTQTKSRICAVFHRHGIFHEFTDLFGVKGRALLAELCREGRHAGGVLAPGALTALRGEVRLLDHVRKELADVAIKLRKELKHDDLTRRLAGIPGFGLILSHVLKSEIGQIERFGGNHDRLASYCLLGPRADDTGEQDPTKSPLGRHLGRRGNRTLKWAFIEAAHGAVRKGGRWRAMFDRVTKGGKMDRNRGYIRVARELVAVVTAIWKNRTTYQETPPARRGGQKASPAPSRRQLLEKFLCDTRSGTGQPYPPMVPAAKA